jgi:hypothetical protein
LLSFPIAFLYDVGSTDFLDQELPMIPLKLSAIAQEHLQELYDGAGIARDELPYTETFESIWSGFQDRTFMNASRDQLYAALLKYTRSSTNSAKPSDAVPLTDDQKKTLKTMVTRHGSGGKLLPYSDAFASALKDFNHHAGASLSEHDFWRAISGSGSGKRRPPIKRAVKVAKEADDEDDGE